MVTRKYTLAFVILLQCFACDDFINVGVPQTEMVNSSVFEDRSTAEAAVVDLYLAIRDGFGGGSKTSISGLTSLSSDELNFFGTNAVSQYQQFNNNSLTATNGFVEALWSDIYNTIYRANAVLEGLNSSQLASEVKNSLTGEAKFIRAFCYFYLVNLWGDVPLAISTDYRVNDQLLRASRADIYALIEADLLESIELLPSTYDFSNGERVRANEGAASALLARVYLFLENWDMAESYATQVIENPLYELEPDLSLVFRATSPEVILQLWFYQYPNDRSTFSVGRRGPGLGSLTTEFLAGIPNGDLRWSTWGQEREVDGVLYHGVLKYMDFSSPPLDYTTLLRLSEQYLIRAEARAQKNLLTEATSDLNIVRSRAGLPNTMAASQQELLDSLLYERQYELFTEWGHRWLDLKRTGKVNDVLSSMKDEWDSEDALYPIPESQLVSNNNIVQNAGY